MSPPPNLTLLKPTLMRGQCVATFHNGAMFDDINGTIRDVAAWSAGIEKHLEAEWDSVLCVTYKKDGILTHLYLTKITPDDLHPTQIGEITIEAYS